MYLNRYYDDPFGPMYPMQRRRSSMSRDRPYARQLSPYSMMDLRDFFEDEFECLMESGLRSMREQPRRMLSRQYDDDSSICAKFEINENGHVYKKIIEKKPGQEWKTYVEEYDSSQRNKALEGQGASGKKYSQGESSPQYDQLNMESHDAKTPIKGEQIPSSSGRSQNLSNYEECLNESHRGSKNLCDESCQKVGSRGAQSQGYEGSKNLRSGMESKGMESRGMESRGMESKGMESRGMESKGMESRGMESKGMESRGMESKGLESRGMESKGKESKDMESRGKESKESKESKGMEGSSKQAMKSS